MNNLSELNLKKLLKKLLLINRAAVPSEIYPGLFEGYPRYIFYESFNKVFPKIYSGFPC